ncbi:aspartate/glutamate racemase family protein [Microbacterium sp. B24]|uniref:aspartate/glutamate racemase family protein n=1 Tax=Microbacterium sp. B24 TaxID=95616 RepID=UPI0003FBB734|nr:aspartate/glutamate racemase family protein [Microbacterium sp. B24]
MKTLVWLEATVGDGALDELWRFLADYVDALAAGRVRTRLMHAGVDAGGIRTAPNRLLSDAVVLARAVEEESAGDMDAIVIGCWGAPTPSVRAAVSVPVTGLAEASVRALSTLSRRAAVVTVAESLTPVFADEIRELGGAPAFLARPVRAYAPDSTHRDVVRAATDPTDLIGRFDAVARRAVDDGADAVVVGCGYLGAIFAAHGYTCVGGASDVPVIDPNRLALEHVLQLQRLADAGVTPTARGYVRPTEPRNHALRTVARSLLGTDATSPSQEGTPE